MPAEKFSPTIVGDRVEFYFSGLAGERLNRNVMKEENPKDNDRLYDAAWGDFLRDVHARVSRQLVASGLLNLEDADRLVFANHSIIFQNDTQDYPQQWPHVDVLVGGQVVVALSDDVPSTCVYTGEYDTAADVPSGTDREASRLEQDPWNRFVRDSVATVAGRSRLYLQSQMMSSPAPMMRGDFSVLTGPTIHAGPSTVAGKERIILFFSFNFGGGVVYNSNAQYGPTNAANEFNNAELIVDKIMEYEDYNPLQFWKPTAGAEHASSLYKALEKYVIDESTTRIEPSQRAEAVERAREATEES
jgi:hypothetical protein